jgi:hypothetical protein
MPCACKGRKSTKYVWTSAPDETGQTETMTYSTEIQAKAKVIRMGGSYVPQG